MKVPRDSHLLPYYYVKEDVQLIVVVMLHFTGQEKSMDLLMLISLRCSLYEQILKSESILHHYFKLCLPMRKVLFTNQLLLNSIAYPKTRVFHSNSFVTDIEGLYIQSLIYGSNFKKCWKLFLYPLLPGCFYLELTILTHYLFVVYKMQYHM